MGHGRQLAVAAGCVLCGVTAHGAEPTREDLQAQIYALKARIAALEAQQRTPAARDVDAVVMAVMQDAERQSDPLGPLLPDVAGRDDDGFFLRSSNGSFAMRPVVQFQFRGVTTYRDDDASDGGDTESGFEVRRLEISVEGNAFGPKLTYEFKAVTERDGGGLVLEDAWVQYEFAKAWGVLIGQFRDPVFHEELVSSKYLLANERSLANALLGSQTGFVQGISLVSGDRETPLHAAVAFHDGAGSINTPFTDTEGETGFVENFGLAGRAEYKLFGDWKNYKDFTAKGTEADLLVLGAASDWTQGDDTDVVFGTVDAQWESRGGLGLYAALLTNYFDIRDSGGGGRFDWGGVVQGAYLVTKQWEGFARYGFTNLDEDFIDGEDAFSEITVGVNYYLGEGGRLGHRAKFTLDLIYLPDGAPSDVTGLGILASDGEEWVLRGQFQLLL